MRVCSWPRLLDQRAAGEVQEHVFKRATPNERALGLRARRVGAGEGLIAVVHVHENTVRQNFVSIAEADREVFVLGVAARRETQLENFACGVLLDELTRRAFGDDATTIHHNEPIAELFGFVHVVSGEHERDALLLQPVETVPQDVSSLRVQTRGWLIEQQ